jgi:uncharacterized membrane protein
MLSKNTAYDLRDSAVADGRLKSLDALRGIALFMMVAHHLMAWLWSMTGTQLQGRFSDYPVIILIIVLGNLAAPLFIVLAGAGASLFLSRNKKKSKSRTLIIRGIFLILLGYALNIITPEFFSSGSWYVLHLIGFCLIVAPMLNTSRTSMLIIIGICVITAAVVAQALIETPWIMNNARLTDASRPGGVFRLAFIEGHFPVLPWAAMFINGMVCARFLTANKSQNIMVMAVLSGFAGVALAVSPMLWPALREYPVIARATYFSTVPFPLSPSLLLILMSLVSFGIVFITVAERKGLSFLFRPLIYTGYTSLTFFIVHVFLFRQVSSWIGLYKTLPKTSALIITFVSLAVITAISGWWSRYDYKYGLEWLMRRVA